MSSVKKTLQKSNLVYQDNFIFVVNKPGGIVTLRVSTYSGPTLQDWVENKVQGLKFKVQNSSFAKRNGISHRLDKDTWGLIIGAKDNQTFKSLKRQFKQRQVKKVYLALVRGELKGGGKVVTPVGRLSYNRLKYGVSPLGKSAETKFKSQRQIEINNQIYTLVKIWPKTGRTHQIRVHFKYLGHPIYGDKLYGGKKNWFLILPLIAIIGFSLWLGRVVVNKLNQAWSGEGQISLAIETDQKDIIILTLTPAKQMITAIKVPAKTMISTPWFGRYQAGKLSLLAQQEENEKVFSRSLTYFFNLPIDSGMTTESLSLPKWQISTFKKKLSRFFFPPKNLTYWRIWRFLANKEMVWKTIDLSNFGKKDFLPDGTEVFRVNPNKIDQEFWSYFSDPVIKQENITFSVFNVGSKRDLAKNVGSIIQNMGARLVEIGDRDEEVDSCLILIGEPGLGRTLTVSRLSKVLGCPVKLGKKRGIGEVKIFIKDVKI